MHFMFNQDGDLESDEEGHARGSSTEATTTRGSSRSKSSGTTGSSSRQTSAGSGRGMVSTDVEEVVKREIESATGSRLAQVSSLSYLEKCAASFQRVVSNHTFVTNIFVW